MRNKNIYRYCYHLGTYESYLQIPQVFPADNLMKPCSPQVCPQEFFTFQTPLSKTPTNKTA